MTSAIDSDVAAELPNYADVAGDTSPNLFHPDSPQANTWSQIKSCHRDEKGYAWLTLQVNSRPPKAKGRPLFFEGDTITGLVHLDADKTDSVKSVYVEVQATTTSVGQEPEIFLALKEVLWSHENAAPKLKGEYDWPFDFTLQKELEVVGPHGKKGMYQLPPSFSEPASPAYLDYRIIVTIKRGVLKANEILKTTFVYQPLTIPDSAPTALRRLAYVEGSSIPGPKQDPEGWKVLEKRTIEGVIFGERDVKVHVQLSLAKPVQYALGSPLPMHLMLESEDSQALDLFSNPTAMRVELIRIITMGREATAENSERKPSASIVATVASRAYFWSVHEPGEGANCRILQGEVDLDMSMKPTFVFPRLSIDYSINFEGFEVTGWHAKKQHHRDKGPLFEEAVTITSRQVAGVSMQSVAPPGYQRPPINYSESWRYLFNGKEQMVHMG